MSTIETDAYTPGVDPNADAEILLDGLSDLAPRDRIAAHGRLIETLERSLAERCAIALETEALLAAVIAAIKGEGKRA